MEEKTVRDPILLTTYEYKAGEERPFKGRMRLLLPADETNGLAPEYRNRHEEVWDHKLTDMFGVLLTYEGEKWREVVCVMEERDWLEVLGKLNEKKLSAMRRLANVLQINAANLRSKPEDTKEILRVSE